MSPTVAPVASLVIVDDHPLFREAICNVISSGFPGSELLETCDLDSALAIAREQDDLDLILLDLNMPGMGGHLFLEHCAEYFPLTVPVIVLSNSNSPRDVERAYWAGANSYLNKPSDLEGLKKFAKSLADYWFKAARLPPSDPPGPA